MSSAAKLKLVAYAERYEEQGGIHIVGKQRFRLYAPNKSVMDDFLASLNADMTNQDLLESLGGAKPELMPSGDYRSPDIGNEKGNVSWCLKGLTGSSLFILQTPYNIMTCEYVASETAVGDALKIIQAPHDNPAQSEPEPNGVAARLKKVKNTFRKFFVPDFY